MSEVRRYLNHIHDKIYEKWPVVESATEMLAISGNQIIHETPRDLLVCFREMERGSGKRVLK